MSSAEENLENMLTFLETQTEGAKDINNVVGHGSGAHTLSSYHPAKKNLWTKWLFYFNKANKNEKVDKDELEKLLTRYIKLFKKFRVKKCPKLMAWEEGTPCTIVSKSLNKLSEEYDLNYSEVPSLIELAAIKVPDEDYKSVSGLVIDPRAAAARGGGKKRKTKKRKKSRNKKIKTSKRKKKKQTNKRKTIKGGAANVSTPILSLAALASKEINNEKDLEDLNSIGLADKDAKNIINEKITKNKQKKDAKRVRGQMEARISSGLVTVGSSGPSPWNPPPRRTKKKPNQPPD